MLQNIPIDVIKVDKIFVDKADLSSNRNIINHPWDDRKEKV